MACEGITLNTSW